MLHIFSRPRADHRPGRQARCGISGAALVRVGLSAMALLLSACAEPEARQTRAGEAPAASAARSAATSAADTSAAATSTTSTAAVPNAPSSLQAPSPESPTSEPSSPEPPVIETPTTESPAASPSAGEAPTVETLVVRVLATYPHDPGAFTQGLSLVDGVMYESTGLYGRSSLRQVAPESGQVLLRHDLPRRFFGEGLAVMGDKLVQLTWKAGLALVYDRETLEPIGEWGYNGEGWGLAWNGEHLVMSDGTPRLTFRSPEDFRWLRTVEVSLEGEPLHRINELEWVDGRLWANLWGDERLVRIDPATGRVDATVDAAGLLDVHESRMVDVLNGVAYDPDTQTFWLTGKFWPKMFQVRFEPATGPR